MARTTMFERSRTRVRFSNEDTDYLFQVVLGYHTRALPDTAPVFGARTAEHRSGPRT